jgi:hypothetical protein
MSSHERALHPQPLVRTVRSPAPAQAQPLKRGLLQIQSSAGNRAAGEFLARNVDQIHRQEAPLASAVAPPSASAAAPPAATRAPKAQFGFSADDLSGLQAFARKHGVVLIFRQPNPHAAAHLDAGAVAKPMEVKAKSIDVWDTRLHPKIGLEHRGLVGYFEAELPKDFHSGKYTKAQRRLIRRRRNMRLAEFHREAKAMKLLEATAPDQGLAVRVKDGIVYQVEPDSVRRFEGGPHERRPRQIPQPAERLTLMAGDNDAFDYLDADGKPLSRARYGAVDAAMVEAGFTEHGAHMRWRARGKAGLVKWGMVAKHALALGGIDQLVRIGPDGISKVDAAQFKKIWPKGYKRAQRIARKAAKARLRQHKRAQRRERRKARKQAKKAVKRRKRNKKQWADKKKATKQRRKEARQRKKAGKVKAKTPSAPTGGATSMKKPPKVDLGDLGSAKGKLPGGGRRLAKIISRGVVLAVLDMVITELIQGPYRRELAALDAASTQRLFNSGVVPALETRIQTSVMKDLEDPSNAGVVARNQRLWLHFPWYLETEQVNESFLVDGLYMITAGGMELYERPHRAFVKGGQELTISASPKSPYLSGKRKARDEKGIRYYTYQQVASVIVHDALSVSFVKQLARDEQAIRKRTADLQEELRGMYLDGAVPPRFAKQFRKVSGLIDALSLRAAVAELEALARIMAKEDDLFPLSAGLVVDDIVARQQRLKRSWEWMDSDSQQIAAATAGERTVNLVLQ